MKLAQIVVPQQRQRFVLSPLSHWTSFPSIICSATRGRRDAGQRGTRAIGLRMKHWGMLLISGQEVAKLTFWNYRPIADLRGSRQSDSNRRPADYKSDDREF